MYRDQAIRSSFYASCLIFNISCIYVREDFSRPLDRCLALRLSPVDLFSALAERSMMSGLFLSRGSRVACAGWLGVRCSSVVSVQKSALHVRYSMAWAVHILELELLLTDGSVDPRDPRSEQGPDSPLTLGLDHLNNNLPTSFEHQQLF